MYESVDAQTVTTVFQSNYALIIDAASRYAPSTDMVYDVVNQAYIDFMNAAMKGQWDPRGDSGPFLYEIAKRRAIDLWRAEKKKTTEIRQRIGEKLMELQRSNADDKEHLDEKIKALDICLNKLPGKSRQLIEKHYVKKISFEKMSEDMTMSSSSLRKAIFRIRLKLRDCITRLLTESF